MRLASRTGVARAKRVQRRVPSTPVRRPSVTVIVLAHNYGRFLRDCAESVLNQRDVDVELLIMDDCSTDETPEVTDQLAAHPGVTIIRNQRNRGQLATLNDAMARVTSEYVAKLDADDLLPPGSLARATALLEAHPRVAFVYGRPQHFIGPVPQRSESPTRSWTIWSGESWLAARCESGYNVISQPEVVMRTSFVRQVGPIREDLPHTFDMHLWMRLASVGDVGRINGPAQGLYRVHEASMQRTIHAGIMVDLNGRRDAFAAALTPPPAAVPDAAELHAMARRSLAVAALDEACQAYDRGHTGQKPVDELAAFAVGVYPEAWTLKEWRALAHRQAVGAQRARHRPDFLLDAISRRLSSELARRHWLRTGER